MQFILDKLSGKHSVGNFYCDDALLDTWLKDHARDSQSRNTSTTYVWHSGDNVVVGYFAISAYSIEKENLAPKISRGSPKVIPAFLLGKLALDKSLQKQGLGGELFISALEQAVFMSESVAARVVVVDAIDAEVAEFYQHYKFIPYVDNPLRLVRKISDIRKDLSNE